MNSSLNKLKVLVIEGKSAVWKPYEVFLKQSTDLSDLFVFPSVVCHSAQVWGLCFSIFDAYGTVQMELWHCLQCKAHANDILYLDIVSPQGNEESHADTKHLTS